MLPAIHAHTSEKADRGRRLHSGSGRIHTRLAVVAVLPGRRSSPRPPASSCRQQRSAALGDHRDRLDRPNHSAAFMRILPALVRQTAAPRRPHRQRPTARIKLCQRLRQPEFGLSSWMRGRGRQAEAYWRRARLAAIRYRPRGTGLVAAGLEKLVRRVPMRVAGRDPQPRTAARAARCALWVCRAGESVQLGRQTGMTDLATDPTRDRWPGGVLAAGFCRWPPPESRCRSGGARPGAVLAMIAPCQTSQRSLSSR